MRRDFGRQYDLRDKLAWVTAGVMGFLWLFGWGFLLRPRLQLIKDAPFHSPKMKYFSSTGQSNANTAMHEIWSPILFSLPTTVGFSQFSLSKTNMMLPPIETPQEQPLFLYNTPRYAFQSPGEVWGNVKKDSLNQMNVLGIDSDSMESPFEPVTNPSVQILFTDELSASDFRSTPIHDDLLLSGAWETRIHVRISPLGLVDSAMLVQRSDDIDRDHYLLRSVYQWQPLVPEEPLEGLVVLARGYPTYAAVEQQTMENGGSE